MEVSVMQGTYMTYYLAFGSSSNSISTINLDSCLRSKSGDKWLSNFALG